MPPPAAPPARVLSSAGSELLRGLEIVGAVRLITTLTTSFF